MDKTKSWFNPEITPKLAGTYRRPIRPSGKNRSLGLVIALAIVMALYFVGCSGVTLDLIR